MPIAYNDNCFKLWIENPELVNTISKFSFLDYNKDEPTSDEVHLKGFIKQIYSEFIIYKSLNVPPPFIIKNGIYSLLNYPDEDFTIYRFDHDSFQIEKYLDQSLIKPNLPFEDIKKRYEYIFVVSRLICQLTGNSSRAFEIFCQTILKEQGFNVNVTPRSWDGGVDIAGYINTFDKKRIDKEAVELHSFIFHIASIFNFNPRRSNLKVIVECKQRKYGADLGTEEIRNISAKFADNKDQILKDLDSNSGLDENNTKNWELVKILMVSTSLSKAANKLKNQKGLMVRVGVQLAWDFIWLSLMKKDSEFDTYFDFYTNEFNGDAFLKNFNEKI